MLSMSPNSSGLPSLAPALPPATVPHVSDPTVTRSGASGSCPPSPSAPPPRNPPGASRRPPRWRWV